MSTARDEINHIAETFEWAVSEPLLAKDPYMYHKGVSVIAVRFGPRGGLYWGEMPERDIAWSDDLKKVLEWFKEG